MPKNVLVLNDSSGSLTPLIEGLARSGYTAYSTENPHSCVELFNRVQASTLMLSLTDPDALDSLQVIRTDPDGATVPIMLFGTGTEGISTAASAQEQGGDFYFEHPINLPEVIGKVQSFVGSGEASPVPIPQQHIIQEHREAPTPPPTPEVAPGFPTLPSFDTATMLEIRRELDESPPDFRLEEVSDLLLEEIQQKDTIEETARAQAEAKKKHLEIELASRKATTQQRLTQLERQRQAEEDAREQQQLERQAQEETERERQRTQLEEQKQLARVLRAQIERAHQERNAEAIQRQELAIQLEALKAERAQPSPHPAPQNDSLTNELQRQSLLLEELQQQARQNQAELQAQQQAIAEQLKQQMHTAASLPPKVAQAPAYSQQPPREEPPGPGDALPALPLQPLPTPHKAPPVAPATPQAAPREGAYPGNTPSIDFSPPLTPPGSETWAPLPLSQQDQEGDLSSPNAIPELFFNLWRNQFSGRVDFLRGALHKSIFFEQGSPVDAHSNESADRYEEYLYRVGKLERAHCQVIVQTGLSGSRRIGAFLVSKGQLKPEEVFTCASAHLREVVISLFGWEEGACQFFTQSVAEDARITLDADPRALIVEGIRRKHLLAKMMGIVGSPGAVVSLVPNTVPDWSVLGLTQDELRALALVDGTRNVEELVFGSQLDTLRVYHLLSALVTLQAAEVVSRGSEQLAPAPCAPLNSIDHRRIQNKLEQVQQRDYFEILGVERSATSYEVEQAYERFCHDFAPDRFPTELKAELRRDLTEIQQVVEDARLVLLNPQTREAYAHHLA